MPSPNSAFPAISRWPSWFMGPLSRKVLKHKWRCSFSLLTGLPSSFIVKEWSCASCWKKWWTHPYITQPFSVNFAFQINFLLHPFFYCEKNLGYIKNKLYIEKKKWMAAAGEGAPSIFVFQHETLWMAEVLKMRAWLTSWNRHCLVKNLDVSVFISLLWNHEQLQYKKCNPSWEVIRVHLWTLPQA